MDLKVEIDRIEEAARAADQTINSVCHAGGINRSTWQRWKAGAVSPTVRDWTEFRERVDAFFQQRAA